MKERREYQVKAVRELPGLLQQHKRVLAVAPTSSGKTVVGAQLIAKMPGARVLWVVHRFELVKQAYSQLLDAGVPAKDLGIHTGREKTNEGARVLVASVQSRNLPIGFDLVVIDEAHHAKAASYARVTEAAHLVLGLTATPWRLDGAPLGDVFESLYEIADFAELQIGGFIAKPICYGLPPERVRELLKGVRTAGGDFNRDELGKAVRRRGLIGELVSEWQRLAEGHSTIVYAVNRKHGKEITQRFRAVVGATSVEYVDGETPADERQQILADLDSGDTRIVVSVDVLSEGFDCKPVKCVVLARPTKSLTLYLQQVGRAGRPHKGIQPIVIDHAGNVTRHGFPTQAREWSLDERAKKAGGDASRHCPECQGLNEINARVCEHCGFAFPVPEQDLKEVEAELQRLEETKRAREAFRARVEAMADDLFGKRGRAQERSVFVNKCLGAA